MEVNNAEKELLKYSEAMAKTKNHLMAGRGGEVATLVVLESEVAELVVEEVEGEEVKPREREAVRVQEVLARV